MLCSLFVFATGLASVAAHATFQEMWVNDVDQGSWCVRLPLSNSPVTDVTSDVRPFYPIFLFLTDACTGSYVQRHTSGRVRPLLREP